MGASPDAVLKRDAMANADCDWYVQLAQSRAKAERRWLNAAPCRIVIDRSGSIAAVGA